MSNTKKIALIVGFLGIVCTGFSQEVVPLPESQPTEESNVKKEDEETYMIVETSAEPPGGMEAFRVHIAKYCSQNYPERAKRSGVQGKVFVSFVIDKDGTPIEISVLKGIGSGCDEVAMEAVRSFGKWSPPMQRGKFVKQRFNLPISFRVEGGYTSGEEVKLNLPEFPKTIKEQKLKSKCEKEFEKVKGKHYTLASRNREWKKIKEKCEKKQRELERKGH